MDNATFNTSSESEIDALLQGLQLLPGPAEMESLLVGPIDLPPELARWILYLMIKDLHVWMATNRNTRLPLEAAMAFAEDIHDSLPTELRHPLPKLKGGPSRGKQN